MISKAGLSSGLLWLLLSLVSLLALHAFVKDNLPFLADSSPDAAWPGWGLWQLKLLDLNNAVTLLIGVLGLLAVRQQIVLSTRPFLGYYSQPSDKSQQGLAAGQVWAVSLRNNGPGVAIVKKQTFRVWLEGESNPNEQFKMTYQDVIEKLKNKHLIDQTDYALAEVMGSVPGNSSTPLFEILFAKRSQVLALDMLLEYEGILGDKFRRDFNLIPRSGP